MKNILFYTALLILLLTSKLAFSADTSELPSAYDLLYSFNNSSKTSIIAPSKKTYNYGIAIKHPKDWEVSKLQHEGRIGLIVPPYRSSNYPFSFIEIIITDEKMPAGPASERFYSSQSTMKHTNYNIISYKRSTLNGHPAVDLVLTGHNKKIAQISHITTVFIDNYSITFNFLVSSDNTAEGKSVTNKFIATILPVFKAIVASVSITKQGSRATPEPDSMATKSSLDTFSTPNNKAIAKELEGMLNTFSIPPSETSFGLGYSFKYPKSWKGIVTNTGNVGGFIICPLTPPLFPISTVIIMMSNSTDTAKKYHINKDSDICKNIADYIYANNRTQSVEDADATNDITEEMIISKEKIQMGGYPAIVFTTQEKTHDDKIGDCIIMGKEYKIITNELILMISYTATIAYKSDEDIIVGKEFFYDMAQIYDYLLPEIKFTK